MTRSADHQRDRHVADSGEWCDGELKPYSPLTHYATVPPVPIGRSIPRFKCEKCGAVRFR